MRSQILRCLRREEQALGEALWRGLRYSDAEHYQRAEPEQLRARCARLVAEFLDALEGSSRSFADYMRAMAADREREGYHLAELQLALDLFRQSIWKLTVESLDDRQLLAEYLDLATTIIDGARDSAARTFVEVAKTRRQAPLETDRLFDGTEAMVITDD